MKSFKNYLMVKHVYLWIAFRLLFSRKTLFGGTAPLALLGIILGVAALVVSMGVVSGFESTLQEAMVDVTGHMQVVQRGRNQDTWRDLESKIKHIEPSLLASARFAFLEAVAAKSGQVIGVLIQGVDGEKINDVLNLSNRLTAGEISFHADDSSAGVLLGKGLAQKLGLSVGDTFKVVVPIADPIDPSRFTRRMGKFRINGILDLGKYDWNERFIVSDLKAVQKLSEIGDRYLGLILKFPDANQARSISLNLSEKLGFSYWIRDWREVNENLFEAVKIERVVIFFVVLIIVIVAAFNASSTLFVNVFQRFADIAILKTLGVSSNAILKIFSLQGVLLGSVGVILGIVLGFILCLIFSWIQNVFGLIPGSVYKLDSIHFVIRFVDVFFIVLATLTICFLATLVPARRGSRLSPVEGLRYG